MSKILIVDDERLIQQLLSRFLEAEGHSCTVAGGIDEARGLLAQDDFDVIFSDVDMPGGSGLELVRELRAKGSTASVVMMSGIEDPQLASQAIDLGVEGYMVKPFKLEEARVRVADALKRRAGNG
jgi:DNA-binding response OmpR family regulator